MPLRSRCASSTADSLLQPVYSTALGGPPKSVVVHGMTIVPLDFKSAHVDQRRGVECSVQHCGQLIRRKKKAVLKGIRCENLERLVSPRGITNRPPMIDHPR